MASLKFKKTYKQGGGDYTTIVNGKEVNIMKQYRSNTWVAQTSCGDIDIERDKLESIRYMLEQIEAKHKLVNEINELEKKAMGLLSYSELKLINKEIDRKLEYFTEAEKEAFFGERYKEIIFN